MKLTTNQLGHTQKNDFSGAISKKLIVCIIPECVHCLRFNVGMPIDNAFISYDVVFIILYLLAAFHLQFLTSRIYYYFYIFIYSLATSGVSLRKWDGGCIWWRPQGTHA